MKRLLPLFIALILLFNLSACSSEQGNSNIQEKTTTVNAINPETKDRIPDKSEEPDKNTPEPGTQKAETEQSSSLDIIAIKAVDGEIKIHFLDVGQGDCTLIETDSGKNMLIDAGNNVDSKFILTYLKELGVEIIDVVIATHPHADHIGSLDDVINTFNIGNIYMPQVEHNTQTFLDVFTAIKAKGLKVTKPIAGEHIEFSEDTKVQILAPNGDNYIDINDYSIAVRLEYGETSFVFTGDAESISEQEIVSKKLNIKSDVLKVGHHGSTTSSSIAFINAVKPKYSIISVGEDNKYGHPDNIILNRLKKYGEVYRTDEYGTVIVVSDGKTITIKNKATEIKENALSQETKKDNEQVLKYIGNKNSKIFHKETCTSLPDLKNQVKFNTIEEAETAGYTGCKRCNP